MPPPAEHQFRPGQSGNPDGRPKGSFSIRTALRLKLQANPVNVEGEQIGKRAAELAQSLIDASDRGEDDLVKALTALIAEVEGRPTEYVERTNVKRFEVNMQPRRGATEPPK